MRLIIRLSLALAIVAIPALTPAFGGSGLTCFGEAIPPGNVGTSGDDDFVGTNGPDVYHGGPGDDIIRGRDGKDRLCGGAGRDYIRGGDHRDRISGGAGNDNGDVRGLEGNLGDDLVEGNRGLDRVDGGGGSDTVRGLGGADELYGGNGEDALFGNGKDDYLYAFDSVSGNDSLNGGTHIEGDVCLSDAGDTELDCEAQAPPSSTASSELA